jgi:alpha(1,3/1,4) fucosyltransferase
MKISVVPYNKRWLNNALFQFVNCWTNHWQEGNVELYRECQRRHHQIGTWDQFPVEQSDIVVFLDYPESLNTVLQIKQRAPHALMVLIIYETPLYNPHYFDKRNHTPFDAILTYNPHLIDNQKYFQLRVPIGLPPQNFTDIPFEQRSPLVMINTNYYIGLRALSRPWHLFNRRNNLAKLGWQSLLTAGINGEKGDLYRARRRLARVAEQRCPEAFDLFGRFWEGRNCGWYHKFFPDPPYKLAKGLAEEDKLQLLSRYRFTIAYENYDGDVGYISEKIFDAFYAGSVPIYWGDCNIAQFVWPESFIDARKFRSEAELLDFIIHLPKSRWLEMREVGQQYLQSEQIKLFHPSHYVSSILDVIEVLGTEREKISNPVYLA